MSTGGKVQSSVDYLFQNMFEISQTLVTGEDTQYELMKKALQQARAMHKEEIIDSFGVGCQVESTRLICYDKMAEQYYNETFNI